MKLAKRWIICKDRVTNKLFPVELTVGETKLLFLVYEKNNLGHWKHIPSCLGYRTRLSKTDKRLFERRHDAIDATINQLIESREQHLKRAEEILEEVRQLRDQR